MLSEKIYDYFQKTDTKRSAKVFKSEDTVFFNPSSFSACKRQIFFKKRHVAPSNSIDAASYLKMQFGTVLHSEIENIVKKIGILIEAEKLKIVEFQGLKFRFKTDGIIVLNKERYIMEIKTVSSGALRIVRDEAKDTDVVQMVLYMIFENIANGVLLYMCRDSAFIEEYVIHIEDYQYKKALNAITEKVKELKILEGQIKSGVLPGRDCQIVMKNTNGFVSEKFQKDKVVRKSDFQCSYCQWKDLCWKAELEQIKKSKFYINGQFES